MASFSPTKCFSPLQINKKTFENFSSPKSSISYSNKRENKGKTIIKKLLEDETNKTEELLDENEVLSKNIKALIVLLVEKDEKLKSLESSHQIFRKEEKSPDFISFGHLDLNLKDKIGFAFRKIQKFSLSLGKKTVFISKKIKIIKNLEKKLVKNRF